MIFLIIKHIKAANDDDVCINYHNVLNINNDLFSYPFSPWLLKKEDNNEEKIKLIDNMQVRDIVEQLRDEIKELVKEELLQKPITGIDNEKKRKKLYVLL